MKALTIFISLILTTYSWGFVAVDGSSMPFISHSEDRPFGSYLILNLPHGPFKSIYENTKEKYKLPLKNRGEAHITVITPPEYDKVLKEFISIKEINQIALKSKIQEASFEMICLGRGNAEIKGEKASTFYVVVKSLDLLKIRAKVFELFIKRGGDKNIFNPNKFYPHITIGFTPRDLHESDGIIKNEKSCIEEVPLF